MPPTSEEIEIGAKAYQRVRWYEKDGERSLRQLPWVLGASFLGVIAVLFFYQPAAQKSDIFSFVGFPAFVAVAVAQGLYLKKRIAVDRLLLRMLEQKYGDSLPWIQDEKTLAAAREMEAAVGALLTLAKR